MPRKGAAAKRCSEMEKMLSPTKSLNSRIAFVEDVKEMEAADRPKMDEGAASALHNLLEAVAEKKMYNEMRSVMNLIYEYALAADEAATSTQSARHVTEGRFCEAFSRAFSLLSPIVLTGADVAAKRPLSALLKLVTYVAEDTTAANADLGEAMLNSVFEQWVKMSEDQSHPRDADIQFLALEFLAVLFSQMTNVSRFFTPTVEAPQKIFSILDFMTGEGSKSAEICALTAKMLADLARSLQPDVPTQSNPITDNMLLWLDNAANAASGAKCDNVLSVFRQLSIEKDDETQTEETSRKNRAAFCAKLLEVAGKTPFRFFECKKIYFGDSDFALKDGIYVTDHCISSLVSQADDEDEEVECAAEVMHIESKNVRSTKGCGHASVSLQLFAPIMSYHEENEADPCAVLHFDTAKEKTAFLSLQLGTHCGVDEQGEDEPFKSQDSRVRCDIAIMDQEGRIVTPMPQNQRDEEETRPVSREDALKSKDVPAPYSIPATEGRGLKGKRTQHDATSEHTQKQSTEGGPILEEEKDDANDKRGSKDGNKSEGASIQDNAEPTERRNRGARARSKSKLPVPDSDDEVQPEGCEEDGEDYWAPPAPKSRSARKPKPSEGGVGADLRSLTMDQLKTLLKGRSLSTKGNKADLVRTLEEDNVRVDEAMAALSQGAVAAKPCPAALIPDAVATRGNSIATAGRAAKAAKDKARPDPTSKLGGICPHPLPPNASDAKSKDAASVFDFSSAEDDSPKQKSKVKTGYRKTAATVKKPAPTRKEPLDVRASSGPAFKAAETLTSRDKYVQEWVKQSAVKQRGASRREKGPNAEKDDSTAVTLQAAAEELENHQKDSKKPQRDAQKDSDKQTRSKKELSVTSPVHRKTTSENKSEQAKPVQHERAGLKERSAKRTLFSPPTADEAPHTDEVAATDIVIQLEDKHVKAGDEEMNDIHDVTATSTETVPMVFNAAEAEDAAAPQSDVAAEGKVLLGTKPSLPKSEGTEVVEAERGEVKRDPELAAAIDSNGQSGTEKVQPRECVERSKRKVSSAPQNEEETRDGESSTRGRTRASVRGKEVANSTVIAGTDHQQLTLPAVQSSETMKAKAHEAESVQISGVATAANDTTATLGLDDSVLSIMSTTQKISAEAKAEAIGCAALRSEKVFQQTGLDDCQASQCSLLDTCVDDGSSPAPMSRTPKKRLFLSGKGGRSSHASLGLSPVAGDNSDDSGAIEPKAEWESPGADQESDSLGPTKHTGIKRPLKSTAFCSMIGQRLERLVSDMGKKKQKTLHAWYAQEESKLQKEVRNLITETNENICKISEQRKAELVKFDRRREAVEKAREEKHQECKQQCVKLYQAAKRVDAMRLSAKERNLERRKELADRAKEKNKKLRAACSAEVKKIEASVSCEKAAADADMLQLKNLIGQLFSE